MTNRLLFAAGRGARLQSQVLTWGTNKCVGWEVDEYFDMVSMEKGAYRIHPDDEALQYGPVSTALREDAQRTDKHRTLEYDTVGGGTWCASTSDWLDYDGADELTRSLFLLILSESLADIGL